jgi:membrane protein YdbS with pleckstrin-like domain
VADAVSAQPARVTIAAPSQKLEEGFMQEGHTHVRGEPSLGYPRSVICPYCGAESKDEAAKNCPSCNKEYPKAPAVAAEVGKGVLALGQEETFFEGRPAVLGSFGALLLTILTLGLAGIFFWLRTLGTKYKITSQRIVVEKGVLSKRMDQVALYRINDFVVERSLGQRIMGTGTITLEAMDKTSPEVKIAGIKTNVMVLYERMRTATEAEKLKKGVRVLDTELQ